MRYLSGVVLLLAAIQWQAHAAGLDSIFAQGTFGEVQMRSEVLWRRATGNGDTLTAAIAAANVGAALTMLGQFEDAQLWQNRSAELLAKVSHQMLLGRLAVAQGITAFLQSRRYSTPPPVDALSHLSRARQYLGETDVRVRTVAAELLGQSMKHEHAQAGYQAYVRLIGDFVAVGDSVGVARYVSRLGCLVGNTGGHQDARVHFERAAGIFQAAGLVAERALALRNVGHACRKNGAYAQAERALRTALGLAEEQQDAALQVQIWNDLSRLYGEQALLDEAMRSDARADRLLGEIAREIPEGRAVDSVTLRFQHLLLLRFASLLPYEADLFTGFYDQLILSAGPVE